MEFKNLLQKAGYNPMPYFDSSTRDYYCIAVRVPNLGAFFANVIEKCDNNVEVANAFRFMRFVKSDSYSFDTMVYFPTIEYQK